MSLTPSLGETKKSQNLETYISWRFIEFIKYIFKRQTSNYFLTLGRRGTGKTDMNLLILEVLNFLGYENFASNIQIKESYFPINHISNMVDLEDWASNTPGSKTYVLDEYGKAFNRRKPMSKINLEIIDKLQILRKYKLNLLAVTIDTKYIDKTGLGADVLDGIFRKPYFNNQKIALYHDNLQNLHERIKNIQRSRVHFNTWDVAPFTLSKPTGKPKYKDKTMEILWDWSHGKTYKDLGVHPQQINRLTRKFIKDSLEEANHTSQDLYI